MMTPQQLARATGARIDRATEFLPHIEAAMDDYEINTPARRAAFLSQIGHESGGLHWLVELWGPTAAQRRYEVRQDLGNCKPGDGYRYRGRGLIQLTGRDNYAGARDRLRKRYGNQVPDFELEPELVGTAAWAAITAADFWSSRSLNALADAGRFEAITRRVNGGLNGYVERLALYERAQAVLA